MPEKTNRLRLWQAAAIAFAILAIGAIALLAVGRDNENEAAQVGSSTEQYPPEKLLMKGAGGGGTDVCFV